MFFSPCCLPRKLCASGVLFGTGVVWCGPARFATPSAAFGRRMSATSTTLKQPYSDKRHSACTVLSLQNSRRRSSTYKAFMHVQRGTYLVARHCRCCHGLQQECVPCCRGPANTNKKSTRASSIPADDIASSERHADAFARQLCADKYRCNRVGQRRVQVLSPDNSTSPEGQLCRQLTRSKSKRMAENQARGGLMIRF